MGLLADALAGANDYANKPGSAPGGLLNPPLAMLANALALPSLATTADRMSYGAPLTNARQANVPFLKPETADALMMAPLSPRNALAAASMGMGMADNGTMKAMNILFKKSTDWGERAALDSSGTYVVPLQWGHQPLAEYRDAAFQAGMERYSPKYDGFFRFTNNKDEPALAAAGKLRKSLNHADNIGEIGLSVADGPHYGVQGYKHGYRVDGDVIGYGSDGEPLLDPAKVRVLSGLESASSIVRTDKKLRAEMLKAAGLPDDYLNTFKFLNDPVTFNPK
jgi:hypothetical protein